MWPISKGDLTVMSGTSLLWSRVAEVEGVQDPGPRKSPQHLLFCREFTFCRDLCAFKNAFVEISTKGFLLLERSRRKASCFRRDLGERI